MLRTLDSTQSREHSYALIIQAIQRAVEESAAAPITITQLVPETNANDSSTRIHEASNKDFAAVAAQFKAAMLEKYGSLAAAFASFSKDGGVNVKKLKKATKKLLPSLPQEHAKKLRKKLNQVDSLSAFTALFGGTEDNPTKQTVTTTSMDLAVLPADVPDRE